MWNQKGVPNGMTYKILKDRWEKVARSLDETWDSQAS